MSLTLIILISSLVVLFVCSACFSGSETAFFSLNPIHIHRIRRTSPDSAALLERILANPTDLLSALLIGNTLVNVAASAVGFAIAEHFFPDYAEMVAIPVMTILLVVLCEVAPKRIAIRNPEKLAGFFGPFFAFFIWLTTPVRRVMNLIISRYIKNLHTGSRHLTEEEYLTAVEVGEEEGVLDEEERTMVDGIVSLEEMQVSEVMTPRVDVVGIDLDDSAEKHEETAMHARYRYLPVFRGSLDNAQGFLDVFSFMLADEKDFKGAIIQPYFVPETMPLDKLLSQFQREAKRIAFVVDEYGGTAGIVTRGDILEEIIPDVEGEYGDEVAAIQKIGDNSWLIDGSTSLDDINYELDMSLEAEGADRISGWVIAQLEALPKQGEVVRSDKFVVTVEKMRRNRIMRVVLEKGGGEA